MTLNNIKKNISGLTILELMIVVAIIGILSSVALSSLTNMKYRAKQAEAKLSLSQIYKGEEIFLMLFSSYSACLHFLGLKRDATEPYSYYAGFTATTLGTPCGPDGGQSCYQGTFPDNPNTQCGVANHFDPVTNPTNFTRFKSTVFDDSRVTQAGLSSAIVTGLMGAPPNGYGPLTPKVSSRVLFTAVAFAFFGKTAVPASAFLSGAAPDIWTIDQTKNLVNAYNGIP